MFAEAPVRGFVKDRRGVLWRMSYVTKERADIDSWIDSWTNNEAR